jgi:hypothetical protein
MAGAPEEETGGGTEGRAEAAEEPPKNQAGNDARGPTTDNPPDRELTDAPTKGKPEAEGERYAAMKAVPCNAASVGGGARRLTKISKPEERR